MSVSAPLIAKSSEGMCGCWNTHNTISNKCWLLVLFRTMLHVAKQSGVSMRKSRQCVFWQRSHMSAEWNDMLTPHAMWWGMRCPLGLLHRDDGKRKYNGGGGGLGSVQFGQYWFTS